MFESLNVTEMNETDVREAIVRPLLTTLGYRHGSVANIRTELTLRYDQSFLGRKSPGRDPRLQGRADYVCEVIPFGRWIVEVKSPANELCLEDAQQAHTYAAHPEVGARYYLITNGREFKAYQTGAPFEPLLTWQLEETESAIYAIKNLLGPEAIERAGKIVIDPGRPLAPGLGSYARIVGGSMAYSGSESNNPALEAAMKPILGMRNGIRGQEVLRVQDGLIEARLELQPAFSMFDDMNRALGFVPIVFKCADEVLSSDPAAPSILSNILSVTLPRGTELPASPLMRGGVVQVDCEITYHNLAVGYLTDRIFSGMFKSEQEVIAGGTAAVRHWGTFELHLS
ncbi:type I restriction endonuclease subunit R [Bradyrhizobium sp. Pa8]|uniref:type I restriction endonuclease subunit R n=1 Tax=Bradyrhizobium sp. Pa8 TaxID=3386552 RepID=UPI00403F7AC2